MSAGPEFRDATRRIQNLPLWLAPLALVALGLIGALLFYRRTGFMYDDAFITFRYAKNLASGAGFVYNAGDCVLGTTTPLFTMLLSFSHRITGVDIPKLAVFWAGLGLGGTAAILYVILRRRFGFPGFALLASIAVATLPYFVRIAGSGMETALFLFLVVLTYYWHLEERAVLCGAAGFLAYLTRPEGAVWMLILLADDWANRRWSWKKALAFGLPMAGWLVFIAAYFHTLIPVNIAGKKLYFRIAESVGQSPRAEIEAALWGTAWAKFRLLAIVAGVALASRSRAREILFALFGLIMLGALYWMDIFVFPWYWGGIFLAGMIIIAFAAHGVLEWLKDRRGTRAAAIAMVVYCAATAWTIARQYRPMFQEYTGQAGIYRDTMFAISDWIKADAEGRPERSIFAKEIGILGYETNLTIYDWGGLVSPQFHPLLAKKQLFEALKQADADYVVYPLPANEDRLFLEWEKEEWFEAKYRPVLKQPIAGRPETYDLFVKVR
ncbi:MAG: hypothetical protein ACREJQ_05915 [bacterium]